MPFDKRICQLYSKDNKKFVYYTATEEITIVAGENGVTEKWIEEIKKLHRIERNGIRHEQRNTSLDALADLVKDKTLFMGTASAEEIFFSREEEQKLRKKICVALNSLSSKQRQLLIDVRINRQTITSIAQKEGVHESSIRERLRRIEKRLKDSILK